MRMMEGLLYYDLNLQTRKIIPRMQLKENPDNYIEFTKNGAPHKKQSNDGQWFCEFG